MPEKASTTVRNASPAEFAEVGQLMVKAYSRLDGFPKPGEFPGYYQMLTNVGQLTDTPGTELLIALHDKQIAGAVVYFDNMANYGANGVGADEKNASGFRLLAVDDTFRGKGIARLLVNECIEKAKSKKHQQVIIHTTRSMQTAWDMYERMGFERYPALDFSTGDLQVFALRLTSLK